MIIITLIEKNLFVVIIFKINELFVENKEIIPLIIVPVIAGFGHTFFLPAFVGFLLMSYQYIMYRRNLTKFHAYMRTVIMHATVNGFAFLANFMT